MRMEFGVRGKTKVQRRSGCAYLHVFTRKLRNDPLIIGGRLTMAPDDAAHNEEPAGLKGTGRHREIDGSKPGGRSTSVKNLSREQTTHIISNSKMWQLE